jgi:hypothetical protein
MRQAHLAGGARLAGPRAPAAAAAARRATYADDDAEASAAASATASVGASQKFDAFHGFQPTAAAANRRVEHLERRVRRREHGEVARPAGHAAADGWKVRQCEAEAGACTRTRARAHPMRSHRGLKQVDIKFITSRTRRHSHMQSPHTHTHTHTHTNTHTHKHTHTHTHKHIHKHTHTHTHTHKHIHKHTNTHTRTRFIARTSARQHTPGPSVLFSSPSEPPMSAASRTQIGIPMPVDVALLNDETRGRDPSSSFPLTAAAAGVATSSGSGGNSAPSCSRLCPRSPRPRSRTSISIPPSSRESAFMQICGAPAAAAAAPTAASLARRAPYLAALVSPRVTTCATCKGSSSISAGSRASTVTSTLPAAQPACTGQLRARARPVNARRVVQPVGISL